ncbi:MAG: DUF4494 domain-containing protein [Clostridium sp.]|nr:DUF4494 domain-containing protein [Prevotella sp.]MCM1429470.1 DUF4494 domain-containing protein [Clostridium sp.]MCM1475496.1 DUF4494 domain-containing protein [Muribaculaceae bacterium]
MALWFECKVRYDKIQENGSVKKANEPYLVDALSFTEAESRIIEEMRPFISGEFSISAVKKTKISEIFFNESGDRYYMVKVNFITLDEKSGMEKKATSFILVQASDFADAHEKFLKGMKGTLADYEISSIAETPLMDVFPADLSSTKKPEQVDTQVSPL